MIIKKFQGKTETEAMELAQKELGEGVVVMNVKNVKPSGFWGLFKSAYFEVTVAKEEETDRYTPKGVKSAPKEPAAIYIPSGQAPVQSKTEEEAKPAEPQPQSGIDRLKASRPMNPAIILQESETSGKVIEEKLDNLQNFLVAQLNKSEDKEEEPEEASKEEDSNIPVLKLLYNTLIDNEVDEKYVNTVMDELQKSLKPNMPMEHILSGIYQRLVLKFGRSLEISEAVKTPKVLYFVGPTGVGKTTTIAKIASHFVVDKQKKVALVTADTYRIAATDQLQKYATIMMTPFRVIYSPEEMEQALMDFKDMDYILVDTAGHSHKNEQQKENTKDFIQKSEDYTEHEVFLVLSATTKYKDLLNIADSYSGMLGEYKLIFTKLDETDCLGNLLNLKLYTGAPMSYITCGQNVPDDIALFDPQSTVKQLLGGKSKMLS